MLVLLHRLGQAAGSAAWAADKLKLSPLQKPAEGEKLVQSTLWRRGVHLALFCRWGN